MGRAGGQPTRQPSRIRTASRSFATAPCRCRLSHRHSSLMKLPRAPTWLGAIVIPWAKAHLSDPRVPEALHNVVRATQYGDMDSDTSKAAYELLHGKFPHNPWTA